jgi:hypothetical protein
MAEEPRASTSANTGDNEGRSASTNNSEGGTRRRSSAGEGLFRSFRRRRVHSAPMGNNEDEANHDNDRHHPEGLQPEGETVEDLTPEQRAHIDYTKSNPLGKILINLLHDQLALEERTGLNECKSNLQDLCSTFYHHMNLQKNELQKDIHNHTESIADSIIQRDLDSHLLKADVKVPKYFSPNKKLLTLNQHSECHRIFPTRGTKFSGEGSGSVLEFLGTMTMAQAQCTLSEPEFLEMLLQSTTGQAHLLIKDWIDHGDTIESIYHNLVLHYDRRLTPEEARLQLMAYKAPKSQSLQKVEGKIMMLATRASANLPAGQSQAANFNNEAISALIRALPPNSAIQVQNMYHTLSARLRRTCTYNELTRALNVIKHGIDADIKQNGYELGGKRTKESYKYKGNTHKRNATTFSNSVSHDTMGPSREQSKNEGIKGNGRFRKNKGQNRDRFRQDTNLDYCSLCGHKDHKASDDCPYMVSDTGKVIKVFAKQNPCTACPSYVSPRLNHPERICPYRIGGPFHGNNKP